MKYALILILTLFFTTGCALFKEGETGERGYVSDLLGINYGTELEYRTAVDERLAEREIDPALVPVLKDKLYALWQGDKQTVLDSYELDEALKTVIINKLTGD